MNSSEHAIKPLQRLLPGLLMLLCLLIVDAPTDAAEVDQFTLSPGQPVVLPDSAKPLAAEVNARLQLAVERANSQYMQSPPPKSGPRWLQPRCDEDRLYKTLSDQLTQSVIGQLESFAEENGQITRRRVTLNNSIYQDFYWQASPTLVLSERLAAVINVEGVELGTDKLGHFFSEGYSYFLATEQLTDDVESGLLFGEWSESVYFGAQTTGVFSFADLTANFQGLRFWNRVLAHKPDPLTGRKTEPYVICAQQRWVVARPFVWNGYVDNAWNEGINCPAFRSADLLARVQRQGAHCRADELPVARYGSLRPRLLNRAGYVVLPERLQPEVILKKRADKSDVHISKETLGYIEDIRNRLEVWRSAAATKIPDLRAVQR